MAILGTPFRPNFQENLSTDRPVLGFVARIFGVRFGSFQNSGTRLETPTNGTFIVRTSTKRTPQFVEGAI